MLSKISKIGKVPPPYNYNPVYISRGCVCVCVCVCLMWKYLSALNSND